MASKKVPAVVDDDNPEWTTKDFARAKPASDVLPPEVVSAFAKPRGRPQGSLTSNKQVVTIRLDNEVVAKFKATGRGWQTRINEVLRDVEL